MRQHCFHYLLVGITLIGISACQRSPDERNQAAVAMPDEWSAAAAVDVLERGGNAIDAAIAASFVLAVTEPEAGNIGGGGFMTAVVDGEASFLDFREVAPLDAHRDMYLDVRGKFDSQASLIGHLAAGVPGSVAGMWQAHNRYGTLPWAELVHYSITLARDGFILPPDLAQMLDQAGRYFAGKTNFSRYFFHSDTNRPFRQSELADTLQRIAEEGADGFYQGETAELIVAEMQRGGGLINYEDLDQYQAIWREPLRDNWRGFELLSSPPPSSGGFAIIQLLKIKDLLAGEFASLKHNSAQYVHLIAEIEKRVFADRARYLGDPQFFDVPIDHLLSEAYLESRAAEVDPTAISPLEDVDAGLESFDTTHYSIIDKFGNAVAVTTTLNGAFGNGVVVEGAGFLLNNEMDDFSAKPGTPNSGGVVGYEANAIEPGKRMLSSMSPTILMRDGEVILVIGTPGGPTIFTTVFQAIINIFDFGMTPLEAAGAPRFHHQLLPRDHISYTPSTPLSEQVIAELSSRGYHVEPHGFEYGDLQIILNSGQGLIAASDPRKRGKSVVIDL